MGQQILRAILVGLILISVIDLSVKTFGLQSPETPEAIRNEAQLNQNVVSSRMTYGRFLEYLEMGWVKQVDLYDNRKMKFWSIYCLRILQHKFLKHF